MRPPSMVWDGWSRRRLLLAALPAAFCLLPAAAQDATTTASDLNRLRPGIEAPAFRLSDASGTQHALADFRGTPTVLVFYRGYW